MNHVTEGTATTEITTLLALALLDALDALGRLAFLQGGKQFRRLVEINGEIWIRDVAAQFHDMQLHAPITQLGDLLDRFLAGAEDALQLAAQDHITRLKYLQGFPAIFPFTEFLVPAAVMIANGFGHEPAMLQAVGLDSEQLRLEYRFQFVPFHGSFQLGSPAIRIDRHFWSPPRVRTT